MPVEIERKFLIDVPKFIEWKESHLQDVSKYHISQGFLSTKPVVRVRVEAREVNDKVQQKASLTIKGKGLITRPEYEYPIPADEGISLLSLCQGTNISKYRYEVRYKDQLWEVDQFLGDLVGLWVAEIELSTENQKVMAPPWVTTEVTNDPRYTNVNLSSIGAPRAG